MAKLLEIIQNYRKPPEVGQLFHDYAEFHETLIPTNMYPLPKRIQQLMERMYELGGIPQSRINRAVENMPQLEQKIDTLEKKYVKHTALGFSGVAAGLIYLFVETTLRTHEPSFTPDVIRNMGMYSAPFVAALSMIHGIRSSSVLVDIKDIRYCVEGVLKNALSTKKNRGN